MRGKEFLWIMPTPVFRITPAYAGKSFKRFFARSMYQDHPRLCGEKFVLLWRCRCRIGSPPPMRGKAFTVPDDGEITGITPAYAGKSFVRLHQLTLCRDHPRLCGEKCKRKHDKDSFLGSPPPMRGKVIGKLTAGASYRITPAYAGKSRTGKYPGTYGIGSPPPMRGKDGKVQNITMQDGITPAYAGKSSCSGIKRNAYRDHPRLCGEKKAT